MRCHSQCEIPSSGSDHYWTRSAFGDTSESPSMWAILTIRHRNLRSKGGRDE
jgi:hypothetical protein